MRYRTFPGTELKVSEIGFGVWTVATGWWGKYTDEAAAELLRQAFDLGITFFDTADTYGNGKGETVLAKALKDQRSQIIIGTKFGYDWYSYQGERTGQRELPQQWDPSFIRFACEESLRRLETDYIDLYQLHNPRLAAVRKDEVFETLESLRQEGKIRYHGVALGPDIGWFEEGEAAMKERKVTSLQIIYSILEQDPAWKFFPIAQEKGTGLLVRVPHASGLLEGKYTEVPTFSENDHRAFRRQEWLIEGLRKVEKLGFLTENHLLTMGQAALKFALAQETVTSVIPNILDSEQLKEFVATSHCLDLTAEDLARITDLYGHHFYLEEARVS